MRVRDDFTVYPRKMESGRVVFYYQCYDENGKRLCGHSTGETTRTMAVKKCNDLLREGKLLPSARKRIPSFGEYAEGWWDWETSEYLKSRRGRRDITRGYAEISARCVERQILPWFGKVPLNRITAHDIDVWLIGFSERKREKKCRLKAGSEGETTGYTNSYANSVFCVLYRMLEEAVTRGIIAKNPAKGIKKLKREVKEKVILTPTEVKQLFPPDRESIWDNEIICRVNMLAFVCRASGYLTGMRMTPRR